MLSSFPDEASESPAPHGEAAAVGLCGDLAAPLPRLPSDQDSAGALGGSGFCPCGGLLAARGVRVGGPTAPAVLV